MAFSLTPELIGTRVRLRPPSMDDVAVLHGLMPDREVSVLTGSIHTSDPAPGNLWALDHLQQIYAGWAERTDRHVWAIVDLADDAVVGEVLLTDLDEGNQSCGFRIWIAGATGRGLGTEATRLVLRHAFEAELLHRVQLEVYAFNPRARRVYEKAGFVVEGTMREALRFDDGWVDAHVMAILAQDWFGPPEAQRD